MKIYLDDRRRKKEITKNAGLYDFGDKNRNEFVFFVPAEKIDFLYLLFLQWSGEKNENDPQKSPDEPAGQNFYSKTSAEEFGFVVIDDPNQRHLLKNEKEHEENLQTELNLNFRWEIVSIFEIKHRLSLSEITEASFLPLPDGTDKSTILNELMIRRIVSFLPARAQGYPWVLIYSSEVHGFSLGTMYRNMVRWKDEMSPTLLVIKVIAFKMLKKVNFLQYLLKMLNKLNFCFILIRKYTYAYYSAEVFQYRCARCFSSIAIEQVVFWICA